MFVTLLSLDNSFSFCRFLFICSSCIHNEFLSSNQFNPRSIGLFKIKSNQTVGTVDKDTVGDFGREDTKCLLPKGISDFVLNP